MMEVELPTAREDVDQLWAASRASLKHKPPEEKEKRDAATKQADHDRNSRTNVVLAWVGSNMYVLFYFYVTFFCKLLITRLIRLMIIVFTSTAFSEWVAKHVTQEGNAAFNPYLTFLFYALCVPLSFLLAELNTQMTITVLVYQLSVSLAHSSICSCDSSASSSLTPPQRPCQPFLTLSTACCSSLYVNSNLICTVTYAYPPPPLASRSCQGVTLCCRALILFSTRNGFCL